MYAIRSYYEVVKRRLNVVLQNLETTHQHKKIHTTLSTQENTLYVLRVDLTVGIFIESLELTKTDSNWVLQVSWQGLHLLQDTQQLQVMVYSKELWFKIIHKILQTLTTTRIYSYNFV